MLWAIPFLQLGALAGPNIHLQIWLWLRLWLGGLWLLGRWRVQLQIRRLLFLCLSRLLLGGFGERKGVEVGGKGFPAVGTATAGRGLLLSPQRSGSKVGERSKDTPKDMADINQADRAAGVIFHGRAAGLL